MGFLFTDYDGVIVFVNGYEDRWPTFELVSIDRTSQKFKTFYAQWLANRINMHARVRLYCRN